MTADVEPLGNERWARGGIAFVRIVTGLLWASQVVWKYPPKFTTLSKFTSEGVTNPVFGPWSFVVEKILLPNIGFFGWLLLITEVALAAFLILGLATRLWALVGLGATIVIMMTVLHAPHEWSWAYYMMFSLHVVILATAAGRTFGLDGLYRRTWVASRSRLARILVMAS